MKTYRLHNCDRQHRSTRTFMECAIPRAAWVIGDGEYACIAWCRVATVILYRTLEAAQAGKAQIDSTGCGGRCQHRHEIVRVAL